MFCVVGCHVWPVLRDLLLQGITKYERTTMKEITHQESLRYVMQGGRWGPNLEKSASSKLVTIKDTEGNDRPTVRLFTTLPFVYKNDGYSYDSPWRPAACVRIKKGTHYYVDKSKPSESELKELQASFDSYFDDSNVSVADEKLTFQWVQGSICHRHTAPIRSGSMMIFLFTLMVALSTFASTNV